MWGISNSNFAGQMGLYLNPSSIAHVPYKREFHLVSADVFADNNYVYLRPFSGVFRKTITGENIPDNRILDYYNPKYKRAYIGGHLSGPAVIFARNRYSWGAHLSWRSANSAANVPYHLAKFLYEGFSYSPQHNINYTAGPWRAAASGWFEVGGTYARVLSAVNESPENKNLWKAGVTATAAFGSYAIFADSKSLDYEVVSSNLLTVNNWDIEYGHTVPNDREEIFSEMFKIKGLGFRTSFGLTYTNNYNRAAYDCYLSADNFEKYKYKIGFSLLDFGFYNNTADGTKLLNLANQSADIPGIDTLKFLSWFYMDTLLSNRFLSRPYASILKRKFSIYTPAATSIQFEFCYKPRWYLNATFIHPVSFNSRVPRRPAQLSITPRYETRRLELAMPVTLFEFRNPSIGFAIRRGIFVIGSDRILTFTGLMKSTGFDLFFGIKWQDCGRHFKKGRKKNGLCPI